MKGLNSRGRAVLVTAVLFGGCGRPDTDVTSSPQYNFAAFAGTTWRTKSRAAVTEVKNYKNQLHLMILAPEAYDPAHPDFRRIPGEPRILAELPPGTRLRVVRLMKDNSNWGGVYVTVAVEGEQFAGKEVSLSERFLSINAYLGDSSDPKEWGVNPDRLGK